MTEIPGEVPPCRACGGKAVVRNRVMREMSMAETSPRVEQVRKCTNPDCPTNNSRERALGDVV